jgi:hypothetical protein
MTTTIDPRYPIGTFQRRDKLSPEERRELIEQIAAAPQRLREAVRVPTIRPYDEDAWAKLSDSHDTPIETSMLLLEALHGRWVTLLRSLNEPKYARTLKHPEHLRVMSIDTVIAIYAWHGRHHVAHITSLRERMGW